MADAKMGGPRRVVIVGGHTGGTTFLSQLRRHTEDARVTLLEKGQYVGYVTCGMAHHIGGTVRNRDALLSDPAFIATRFNADFRLGHEAVAIDRKTKLLRIIDHADRTEYFLPYDKLVLALGARPRVPEGLVGANLPRVHVLRTIADMDAIVATLSEPNIKHAAVVGAGTIGLQMAENLRKRGVGVTLLERSSHVMSHMDRDMGNLLQRAVRAHGVDLRLNAEVIRIEIAAAQRMRVATSSGGTYETDMVMLAAGLAPNVQMAAEAGLAIGALGGIVVDSNMRTSDPDIYAVGDVVESKSAVTGHSLLMQLAGPIARQSRVAAAHIMGKPAEYAGTLGSFAWRIFDETIAATGASEAQLAAIGRAYEKVLIPSTNHVAFFPGVRSLHLKLLFCPESGRLLGAQAVGEGADKRIDVLATAIAGGMTVHDLVHLELAYSPHFGSPKDAINQAAAMASGVLSGSKRIIHPEHIGQEEKHFILDIRTAEEVSVGSIPGAVHIPLEKVRDRLADLPGDRLIVVCCQIGIKAHSVQRMLALRGHDAVALMGGYAAWRLWHEPVQPEEGDARQITVDMFMPDRRSGKDRRTDSSPTRMARHQRQMNRRNEWTGRELDARGLVCPGPILRLSQFVGGLAPGETFRVLASDPGFPKDLESWCRRVGHQLERVYLAPGHSIAYGRRAGHRLTT